MTRRGYGLLIAAVASFLAARTFGVRELHMVAVALLVLVVIAILRTWNGMRNLDVARTIAPTTLAFGERATVRLNFNNTSRLPTTPLELLDTVPQGLGAPEVVWLGEIPAWRSAVSTYELVGARRGTATIGPARLRTADPFGIVARTRAVASVGHVTVLPQIVALPDGLPISRASSGISRGSRRSERGSGELAGVRDYIDGDDLRAIHWASTAHRGKLIVRRDESPRTPRAVVLLDIRAERHAGSGADASIETAVTACASVAHHLAVRGRPVVVVDRPTARPPRPMPWDLLSARLADVQPTAVDFDAAITQVAQGVGGDGTLVAVITPPGAHELRRLVQAARGFATRVALVVDPLSHDDRGPTPDADSAVAALTAAGIRAIVLRRGDRLDERWKQMLAQQRRSRAGSAHEDQRMEVGS